MPNPYAALFDKKKKPPLAYQEVGGAMNCQTCNETVREGRFYASEELLVWKCSKDHVSKIEYRG